MKIVKIITLTLSISVLVTAAAAVLNTLSEHVETNDSVAVMANSGGDNNIKSISKTTGSISSLITEALLSLPAQISRPFLSVLDCVYVGSKQIINLVLSFILPS